MSLKNKQVLKYLNLARQYPKYYVGLIDEQLNSFVDEFNIKLGEDVIYETIEGKTLWEEVKAFLLNQEPLRPLDFHEGLAKAASDHAKDIVKNKSNGHTGSDGSTFIERIERYCKKGKGSMIELLGTTHKIPGKNSIQLGILNFIIDDGVTNRGHRRALFSKDYKYVGLQFGEFEDKIYSVVTITQANLEILTNVCQNVGTSTTSIKKVADSASSIKENSLISQKEKGNSSLIQRQKGRSSVIQAEKQENCPNNVKCQQRTIKRQSKTLGEADKSIATWTFRLVENNLVKPPTSKVIHPEKVEQEPSIFRSVESSQYDNSNRKSSRGSQLKANSKRQTKENENYDHPVNIKSEKQSSNSISNSSSSKIMPKQSTITSKPSRQAPKSVFSTSEGYGLNSEVDNFKQKSKINSVFSKSNSSSIGFGSTFGKKVVQKKEKIRNWCQDEFMIKQITTMVKYEDGTVEDLIQKHSILKDSSNSLQSQQSRL